MASCFPWVWICSADNGTDCQQLGAFLLQQFHGSWSSACCFDYSIPGNTFDLITGTDYLFQISVVFLVYFLETSF